MSVNSISTLLVADQFDSAQNHSPVINVAIKNGETLSPKQFLELVVKQALGTSDSKEAARFLAQSGLEQHHLPHPQTKNGQTTYSFKTNDKFWKSIESFKTTGKAISLFAPPVKAPALSHKSQLTAETIAQTQTQNRGSNATFSRETVRQGKDGGQFNVAINPAQFVDPKTGKTTVADGDERKEVLEAAANSAMKTLGYSQDAVAEVLKGYSDNKSLTLNGQDLSETDLRKILVESAKTGKLVDIGLEAAFRKQLYRAEVNLHGSEKEKLGIKIDDELAKIDQKYALQKPPTDAEKIALELAKNNEKKAAVDRLVSQAKDVRSPSDQNQTIINQGVDFLEKAIRASIDSHPLYRFLPEEAKRQMTDFGIGIGRGTVTLASAGKGVNDFFHDAATDALLYAAKETGLDKKLGINVDQIQKDLSVERQSEAKLWSQLTNASTNRIAKNDLAFELKNEAGLKLDVYDTPNWAVKGGEITAQAVPFIAVGVATGGASIPVSMAVAGGTSGLMALGGTYSQTRQYEPAMKAAVIGTVQGAVMPLAGKLGLPGEAVANVAFAYTAGKLQGRSDAEIQQDIVLQLAQAGAFHVGGKLHETLAARSGKPLATETEVRAAFEQEANKPEFLQTVKEEVAASSRTQVERFVHQTEVETVAKNLEQQRTAPSKPATAMSAKIAELQTQGARVQAKIGTQAKEILAGWGKNNRVFTTEQYSRAQREALSNKLYSGIPADKIVPLTKIAGYHLEAGARAFSDFVKVVKAETISRNIKLDEADFQKLYHEASNEYLTKLRETLSEPARAEFDEMRTKAGNDETFLTKLPNDDGNVQKMFENIAQKKAGQPDLQAKQQAQFQQARQDILNNQTFLQSAEVKKVLTNPDAAARTKDLRSAISVELTKQELAKQYPASTGYKVISEVDLFQDTGFATKADYYKANPGKSAAGMEEISGRLWLKVTDLDVVVVKPDSSGKLQIVQLEQIKSGKTDVGSDAKVQIQKSVEAIQNAKKVEVLMRQNSDKTILGGVDVASVDTAKKITRGVPGKAGFDESLPLTSSQMNQIAKEIEELKQRGAIK